MQPGHWDLPEAESPPYRGPKEAGEFLGLFI
jgi:hypothetical protein